MKKKIAGIIAATLFIFISFSSSGQETGYKIPAWVSDKGYWVVETNVHAPLQHIVRFYNNENTLVGTSNIDGTKLKINKRKVKMQLKAMLESSLSDWAARAKPAINNTEFASKP